MNAAVTPTLRYDAVTGDWIIFAPTRAERPQTSRAPSKRGDGGDSEVDGSNGSPFSAECPFCPGNEEQTTTELLRLSADDSDEWRVRVVSNKFPALEVATSPSQAGAGSSFRQMGGYGAHEVVIESPHHSRLLAEQPIEQIEKLLRALQQRYIELARDPKICAVVIYKNHGRASGTSLAHPHWQIIATPVVPPLLATKYRVAKSHFDESGKQLLASLLQDELAEGVRVLAQNEAFVALLPYASHWAYQVRILPRDACASFGAATADHLTQLAPILQQSLARLHAVLDNPDLNLTFVSAPTDCEGAACFRWHVDILPRLNTAAGFELASGMAINPVLPEPAALALRGVAL